MPLTEIHPVYFTVGLTTPSYLPLVISFIHSHCLTGPYGHLSFPSKGETYGDSLITHLLFDTWKQIPCPLQTYSLSAVTQQSLLLCRFLVTCHGALLLGMLSTLTETRTEGTKSGLICREYRARIKSLYLDKRMMIHKDPNHPD